MTNTQNPDQRAPPSASQKPTDAVPVSPGDEAPPGTPGTGENVCRACGGSGQLGQDPCPDCNGTGVITQGIGGA